jgi:hypothetical protein
VRGVQTNDLKQKNAEKPMSHAENFFRENSQKIGKIFDVSFPRLFFVLLRFQVLLSDGNSKTLQNNNRVETFYKIQKNRQKSKTDFFSILFYHVFVRFSVRGV